MEIQNKSSSTKFLIAVLTSSTIRSMKRKQLVNHIQGSYLKEEYLEAFLVQSAYIEGLLRTFADYQFWQQTSEELKKNNPLMVELRKRIKRYNLGELIDFLFKSNLIDRDQKGRLNDYWQKRNSVMHDLVTQMATNEFTKELKITCELGDKIIEDVKFKEIEKILDDVDIMMGESVSRNNSPTEMSQLITSSPNPK